MALVKRPHGASALESAEPANGSAPRSPASGTKRLAMTVLSSTAERVQVDTYIACGVLAETLASMYGEFVPDFLVERIEVMLSGRIINGYYSRLGLAPGQRFASKGGYLVRFVDPTGARVEADGNWIVP